MGFGEEIEADLQNSKIIQFEYKLETYFDIAYLLGHLVERGGINRDRRELPALAATWANEFNQQYLKHHVEGWIELDYLDTVELFALNKFKEWNT